MAQKRVDLCAIRVICDHDNGTADFQSAGPPLSGPFANRARAVIRRVRLGAQPALSLGPGPEPPLPREPGLALRRGQELEQGRALEPAAEQPVPNQAPWS